MPIIAVPPIVRSIIAIVSIGPIVPIRVIIAVWVIPGIIPVEAWKSDPYSDRYPSVGTLNRNEGEQRGRHSDQKKFFPVHIFLPTN